MTTVKKSPARRKTARGTDEDEKPARPSVREAEKDKIRAKVASRAQTGTAIRHRLRRAELTLEAEYEAYTKQQGSQYKPVEEWDLDELAYGKPRQPDGTFKGKPPHWLTPLVKQEVQKRLREETLIRFNQEAATAVRVLADFLKNDEEPRLRFDAAKLILEYVVGKPNVNVTVDAGSNLQAMLASALVLPNGEEAHPMIEGAVVEDEDEDEADDEDL